MMKKKWPNAMKGDCFFSVGLMFKGGSQKQNRKKT